MHQLTRRTFLKTSLLAGVGAGCLPLCLAGAAPAEPATSLPTFPITDSHVHFWDTGRLDYGWLRRSSIGGPKLPADYWQAAAGLPVEKVVFVQAECRRDQAVDEAAWVEKLAQQEPRIGAIVAFAPMDDEQRLTACLEDFSRRPLVKGIRHLVQGEHDREFCLQPAFVAGVRRLAKARLSFDVGARDEQLPAVIKLVEECPEVTFVLNHLGNPRIKAGAFKPWDEQIRRLAGLPNLVCKVSGAATHADWKTWKPDDLRPYIEHVLNTFGFDRVLFGSDWPVCTQACTLRRWVEVLTDMTRSCKPAEKTRLFSGNARRVYRL